MRKEWKMYWYRLFTSLKGYGIAIGVSGVFYLFHFPNLHGWKEHLQYFLVSLMYGQIIYSWIWLFYAIQWAIVVHRQIHLSAPLEIPLRTQIFLGLSGTALGIYTSLQVESKIFNTQFTFPEFWQSLCIGLFICLMFHFFYAYKAYFYENLSLKAAKSESDLHVLKNQMQPHFLFNSLNSLASLIEENRGQASEATQNLSDLYRLILESSKHGFSPLQRELQIVMLYLQMEKIRFSHRLEFEILGPWKEKENISIPSLLLQTLVENAIKHGIAKSISGGKVSLVLEDSPPMLILKIINTGAPLPMDFKLGTGLQNSKDRVALLYKEKASLNIHSRPDQSTEVALHFPGVSLC